MCLYTNKRSRIAKEDIQVFKMFRDIDGRVTTPKYVTPFRRATLSFNKLLPKVMLGVETNYFWFLNEYASTLFEVNEGYHAYTINPVWNRGEAHTKIFNATIPKGTRYYINKHNHIVAETIIIHADINIK